MVRAEASDVKFKSLEVFEVSNKLTHCRFEVD